MSLRATTRRSARRSQAGFTLVEVLVGSAIGVFLFASLYLGLSHGFMLVQVGRENTRATQILQEKMETVWLYNWDQINTPGFIPPTFEAAFVPGASGNGSGFTYHGEIQVGAAPVTEGYGKDLRQVTVRVRWTSGVVEREREMTTLVSRHGMHHYIYRRH